MALKNESKWFKVFWKVLAVVAVLVLILDKFGPKIEYLNNLAFIVFTILCIGMGIELRKSIGKIIIVALFFIFGLVFYL
ncbi:hypothetical protein J2S25_003314 [Mesobacillus stamsii]|uniref:DUF3953 domain-containing protein n=1 Tax=Mesobacillus stamsii TaxID=225347 RepID=A0ABU0FZU6_9BACI|nr:hypothetical protein [Mesobacillus stamsii]